MNAFDSTVGAISESRLSESRLPSENGQKTENEIALLLYQASVNLQNQQREIIKIIIAPYCPK